MLVKIYGMYQLPECLTIAIIYRTLGINELNN